MNNQIPIPIRCFSCGKVIGDKWELYLELLKKGLPADKALTEVGCTKYCCRRMILSHVECSNN
jgi:DNA-directed RNA polymerase I, II, and III subunit RPABC5